MSDNATYSNYTSNTSTPSVAGAAISGGYNGDSFAIRALIPFLTGLSMYNSVELMVLIFFTFNKFKGLYFWSLIVSGVGIIPYALGFLFKFLEITEGKARWLAVALLTIGWWMMVTGQSVVLWSRLHLLVEGEQGIRTLRWTKWMIIINAIVLHIPTTVLTFGSNGNVNTETFVKGYNVMEKIQMSGFFVQEVILSSIYIWQTAKIIRTSIREDSKKFMIQLLGINVLIIVMDLALLALEAASQYLLETLIKGVIYSIKLKLEFAILGKLVQFVGGRSVSGNSGNEERWKRASVGFGVGPNMDGVDGATLANGSGSGSSASLEEKNGRSRSVFHRMSRKSTSKDRDGHGVPHYSAPPRKRKNEEDISDFVDLSRVRTDISHAEGYDAAARQDSNMTTVGLGKGPGGTAARTSRGRRGTLKTRPGVTDSDIDLARFLHVDDVELPDEDNMDDDMARLQKGPATRELDVEEKSTEQKGSSRTEPSSHEHTNDTPHIYNTQSVNDVVKQEFEHTRRSSKAQDEETGLAFERGRSEELSISNSGTDSHAEDELSPSRTGLRGQNEV